MTGELAGFWPRASATPNWKSKQKITGEHLKRRRLMTFLSTFIVLRLAVGELNGELASGEEKSLHLASRS